VEGWRGRRSPEMVLESRLLKSTLWIVFLLRARFRFAILFIQLSLPSSMDYILATSSLFIYPGRILSYLLIFIPFDGQHSHIFRILKFPVCYLFSSFLLLISPHSHAGDRPDRGPTRLSCVTQSITPYIL
jgi:hypothetical protein